jgi:ABC-type uncharacterized transport system substrate-binding protein
VRRRQFLGILGGTATWPIIARAQQSTTPVIGFLNGQSPDRFAPYVTAFKKGLGEAGYVEGQNVSIEYRWANGQTDRMKALAAELVDRRPRVIVATGGGPVAAKLVPDTIPVVTLAGGDPVRGGLVASYNRPGGNITAVSMFAFALGPKRLEILRELLPKAKVIAVLVNSSYPDLEPKKDRQEVETTARAVGQQINVLDAGNDSEIETAFATLVQQRNGALLVMADPFFNSRREQLVALAAHHKVPAIFEWREFATVGGLMSYGSSITDAYRQVGIYAGKILAGAKPADLPVVQTVKVELVINLKTAKALGITVPQTLLARADEVIE